MKYIKGLDIFKALFYLYNTFGYIEDKELYSFFKRHRLL